MKSILRRACAKINLGLEVLHKRPDNFHEINTVFLPVSLCDELEFIPAAELSVECSPDLGIPQEENLVYRAALALRKKLPVAEAAKIRVKKQIPSGAGLGGGSSDAAAALLALCELWNISPDKGILHGIATELGSDVPFFLESRPAAARGRGEILNYFSIGNFPWDILIVYPNEHVSTPWAYRELGRDTEIRQGRDFRAVLEDAASEPGILRKELVNDFESVVFRHLPELERIKLELYGSGAVFALMSGSGSALFGLFDSRNAAESAARRFTQYRTYICRQIPEGS